MDSGSNGETHGLSPPLALSLEERTVWIQARVSALVQEHGLDVDLGWIENAAAKGEIIPWQMHVCDPQCSRLPAPQHKAYKLLLTQHQFLIWIEGETRKQAENLRFAMRAAARSADIRSQAMQLLLERAEKNDGTD